MICFSPAIKEAGIMSDAVRRVFKEELEEERKAGRQEVLCALGSVDK